MKCIVSLLSLFFLIFNLRAQQLVALYPSNLNTNHQSPNQFNPHDVGAFIDYDFDPFHGPYNALKFDGNASDEVRIYNRMLSTNKTQFLADYAIMPDLMAWFPLSGNAKDVSGNNRNGTLYGSATYTTDKYNQANSACFIANPESGISVSNSSDLDFIGQPFAISAWVKYSNIPNTDFTVVAKNDCSNSNGYVLSIYNNIPRFYLSTGAWSIVNGTNAYNDNKWHHLVATYDGQEVQKLYVDGRLEASASSVLYNNPSGNAVPITIGDANGNCGGGIVTGNVDEVKIYGGDLDTMQVKALFRQCRSSGNALSFLEANQSRVDIDTTLIGDEFSIESWVKTSGFEGSQYVVRGSGNGSWSFGMHDQRLILQKGTEPALTSSTVPIYNNDWHHIAVSVKNNLYTFFYDGSPVGNGNTPAQASQASRYFLGQSLNGTLDEIRIWKKELSLVQIRRWMNRKITSGHPAFADLQHYYNFDEPNLEKTCEINNGQTGTLLNEPQYDHSGAPIGDTAVVNFDPVGSSGLELVLSQSDSVSISGWIGNVTGLAIYAVLDAPAHTTGIQGLGRNNHYFGTISYPNVAMVQFYKYGNNHMVSPIVFPTVALYYRRNNASPDWGSGTEVTHNPFLKQFFTKGPGGEWILGSTGVPLKVSHFSTANRELIIYPNPASEVIYFKGIQTPAILTLRDVAGRIVVWPTKLEEKQGLPVSNLKPGLYFIQIQEGNQRLDGKVMIHQQ